MAVSRRDLALLDGRRGTGIATTVVRAGRAGGHRPSGRLAPPPRERPGRGRAALAPHPRCVLPVYLPGVGRPATTWRRGGGGLDVTDERRPRRNPPPDQRPDPNEEFRRALERETDLSLREDPERRRLYRTVDLPLPGRPAMTDRRPRDDTTATTCSRGTARRSPSSGGRSGRASGSRHCCAGVARAGRSSRCLRRRRGRTGDDPTQFRVGRRLRCFLAWRSEVQVLPGLPHQP